MADRLAAERIDHHGSHDPAGLSQESGGHFKIRMMKATAKLFMVLITVVVAVIGWITGQYKDRDYLILILVLISATLITFLLMNIHDHRLQARKRKEREYRPHEKPGADARKIKRSDASFSLKEKKSGLSWGGGNIKASEATRGTRRKFLGR